MPKSSNTRVWIPVALAVVYLLSVAYAWLIYAPSDDTYIYLVYAKNFLKGNGLTYNGMKVQGFTSVLWMALIVLVGKIGVALPTAANILSGLSGLLVVVMTYFLGRSIGLAWRHSLAAVVLVAATGDFAFYMSNGLESVLFAGMVVWSVSYLFREDPATGLRSWWLPVALSLTVFSRPEGLLVAAIVLGVLFWECRRPVLLLRNIAVMAALMVPVLVWAQSYYGSWLPNTFYAKAGAGLANLPQGMRYLRNFIAANSLLSLFVLYPLLFRFKRLDRVERLLFLIIGVWVLNITVQGGDNMVGYRAYLPVIPLFCLLAVYLFRDYDLRRFAYGAAMVCLCQLFVYNSGYAVGSSWNYDVKFHAAQWRKILPQRIDIANHLKERLPANAVIAVNAAGTVPYYSELPTIDMLGLNNEFIARHGGRDRSLPYGHQAGDGAYVMRQKPAALMFAGMGTTAGELFLGDRQIEVSREFRMYYELKQLPHGHHVYIRSDRRIDRQRPGTRVNSGSGEENKR
jgi:hypothetical protein